ncbi:MAG: DUF4252 domain-containing protein [Capnocytophaga sp.]|nr:DUF4252 domain-containing protein [Capnocytophaga sp.]
MKAKCILLTLALLAVMQLSAQSVFDKFEDNNEVTTVVVSQKMFEMLSKIDSSDPEAKEFMEIAKKLTGLKIFTTKSSNVAQTMRSEVDGYLKKSSLSELMRVKDSGNNVRFYVREGKNADHVSELLMFAEKAGNDETVLMTLTGDIDLNKIGTLTKNMNLPDEVKSVSKNR